MTLEIFDDAGALVRRFSSDDVVPPADPETSKSAPVWLPGPMTLSTEAGMHRFVWSLREPLPAALAKNVYDDGAWAPPGHYRLVLTVDGRRHEQPLEIVPDPRVELPTEAYREQPTLAVQVLEMRASVNTADNDAKELLLAIRERRPQAPEGLWSAFDALVADTAAVSGIDPDDPDAPWWRPPKSVNTLRWLDRALDNLYDAIDGADAAPAPTSTPASPLSVPGWPRRSRHGNPFRTTSRLSTRICSTPERSLSWPTRRTALLDATPTG